ncbi:MAG: toll/interleukin-1 receptor domain-containing protein [FCB group bacterium]|jgi:tetratricopeptide (TPR) repeat protein|nr:toll/interleukin-1 receptor domain-containing protein [FCB group bacterium]
MADVLLSYLESDGPWVDWVEDHLAQAGYSAKRHAWNFSEKGTLPRLCQLAKAEGLLLVTVASPAYMNLVHNQPDWATAFSEAKTKVLCLRVKVCTISAQLCWHKAIDLFALSQEDGAAQLLAATKESCGAPKGLPLTPQSSSDLKDTPLPSRRRAVYRVGCAMSSFFVGRTGPLTLIEHGTQREGIAVIQGTPGQFGLGSSQLAAEYAYHHWSDYRVIWWVRAGNRALINADLSRLSNKLGLTEKSTHAYAIELKSIMRWMDENDGWLFIFDDATNAKDVEPFLPKVCKGHLLVTSDDPNWWGVRHRFRLTTLDRADSIQYLLRRLHEVDESSAAVLASELSDLPLLLQLAGSYMLANSIPLSEYVDLFFARRRESWKDGHPPRALDFTLRVILTLSLEQVMRENEDALTLAKAFMFMHKDTIRLAPLLAGAKKMPSQLTTALSSPQAAAKAITTLVRYGLIEEVDDVFRMHQQVQKELLKFQLSDPSAERNKPLQSFLLNFRKKCDRKKPLAIGESLLQIVQEAFPDVYHDAYRREECAELSGDAVVLLDRAHELGLPAEPAAELGKRLGAFLHYSTCYEAASDVLKRALEFQDKAQGRKHARAALILTLMGSVRWAMCDLPEARANYEAALRIDLIHKKGPDPEVAKCLQNLGHICQEMGLFVDARNSYMQALDMHRKLYGDVHKSVAADYADLGLVAQKLGDTRAAWRHYKDALEMYKEVYGPQHPSVSTCMKNFGGLLYAMGDHQGAYDAFRHALKLDTKLYADGHPEIARDHNNLGLVLQQQGKLEEAEQHYLLALEINRMTYGNSHPKLAIQLNNLGSLRQAHGDAEGAKNYYAQASKILVSAYGMDHPLTVQTNKNMQQIEL